MAHHSPDVPSWRPCALVVAAASLSLTWALVLGTRADASAAWIMAGVVAFAAFLPIFEALQSFIGAAVRTVQSVPGVRRLPTDAPRTLIVMVVRDEPPEMIEHALTYLARDLTRDADHFELCIASDTRDEAILAEEAHITARLCRYLPTTHVRRTTREGKKVGNLRNALRSRGAGFEFCLLLDADSVMRGDSVRAMVCELARDPGTVLIQSLVRLAPHKGRLARRLAFGTGVGYGVHMNGLLWWRGRFGPYWGHNAVFRIAEYVRDAHLPQIEAPAPWGGHVLSHDMAEVALLASQGHRARFVGVEESWEGTPPTLEDYLGRERRWALGNVQYTMLLAKHGGMFAPRARLNLLLALITYVAPMVWLGLVAFGAILAATGGLPRDALGAWALTGAMGGILIANASRLIGALNCERKPGFWPRLGLEAINSLFLAPIVAATVAGRLIRALLFGDGDAWGVQARGGTGGAQGPTATGGEAQPAWRRRIGHIALGLALLACASMGPPLTFLLVAPIALPLALSPLFEAWCDGDETSQLWDSQAPSEPACAWLVSQSNEDGRQRVATQPALPQDAQGEPAL